MKLESVLRSLHLYTRDAILITEAEPLDSPGPLIVFANEAFEHHSGYGAEELIGKNPRILQGPGSDPEVIRRMGEQLKRWKPVREVLLNYRKDGSEFWVDMNMVPVSDEAGIVKFWVSIQRDVTDSIVAQEKLLAQNDMLAFQKYALDEHAIVSVATISGRIKEVNQKFCEVTGYSAEELIGQNHRIIKSGNHPAHFFDDLWQTISNGKPWHGEIQNKRKDGTDYWVKTTIVPRLDDRGKPVEYVSIRTDITQRKQAEKRLERLAYYDPLTGLMNKNLLEMLLSYSISEANKQGMSTLIVALNLDNFKSINRVYGSDVADQVLIAQSARLQRALPETAIFARLGGDDFCIALQIVGGIEDAEKEVNDILALVAEPLKIDGAEIKSTASIGATWYPLDNVGIGELLRHAEQAMYASKRAGKNQFHFFDADHENTILVYTQRIAELRKALINKELVLFYHPKVNLRTGAVIGVEALIRWQHPERGLLAPLDFLPQIEDHKISVEVGEWVIEAALNQVSRWQKNGIELPVSVNISPYHLTQRDFVERLGDLLRAHPDVSPSSLEIEILEHSSLVNVTQVSEIITACGQIGVRFSIDDFGTGYSSLTYLKYLPATMIKIDQSFIRDMLKSEDDRAIVESVVNLSKSFKRDVIAEGVETIEHAKALLAIGCNYAQGFGIAKPMPESALAEWLLSWKKNKAWHSLTLA
ncbi:EAL domain-containing protein [Roseicyclus marinus]|uniref:EAL domain-containing protein n=1 Tax=Roseicyclus marinus TaxID=2161673 RepID=UPI00240F3C12|nr:EAL domain-containing protein [Roseicyclus marinus]MDG3039697.1 EAL domain-containing protein [Roseicyclus marinus]